MCTLTYGCVEVRQCVSQLSSSKEFLSHLQMIFDVHGLPTFNACNQGM